MYLGFARHPERSEAPTHLGFACHPERSEGPMYLGFAGHPEHSEGPMHLGFACPPEHSEGPRRICETWKTTDHPSERGRAAVHGRVNPRNEMGFSP
jgi:hypothetical protein